MDVEPELKLSAQVLRNRIGQLLVNERLKNRAFKVPVHLALGHEAVAVAVAATMQPEDALCLTHRNIHYNIARAHSLKDEIDELALNPSGVGSGWFGSMNMANPEVGILYTSSILGNNLCVGAGIALADQVRQNHALTIIVTGDGAMEEGSFYETLEFLKSFNLSVMLLVENNDWSLATRTEERRCPIHLDKLAQTFDIPYATLRGNDVHAYHEQLLSLRTEAITNRTPVLVQAYLTTLGDWRSKVQFINYHHGAASTVEYLNWPLIRASEADPLFVLEQRFGTERLHPLAMNVREQLEAEIQ